MLVVALAAVLLAIVLRLVLDGTVGAEPVAVPAQARTADGASEGRSIRADSQGRLADPQALEPRHEAARAPEATSAEGRPSVTKVEGAAVRLVGRVVDSSGAPWKETRVLLGERELRGNGRLDSSSNLAEEERVRRTRSDDDGGFAFDGVERGWYRLALRHGSAEPLDLEEVYVHGRGGEQDLGTLGMHAGVRVVGRVVDDGGRPVPGARVLRVDRPENPLALFPDPNGEKTRAELGRSSGDGRFSVGGLNRGTWELLVETEDFLPKGVRGESVAAGIHDVGDVRLRAAARIEGRIVCAPTMDPGGFVVRVEGRDGTRFDGVAQQLACAADGTFSLSALPGPPEVTRYSLRAGRKRPTPGVVHWVSDPLDVGPGERGVIVEVAPLAGLEFRVVDAESATALEGVRANLEVWEGGRLVHREACALEQAEPGGSYTIANLPPLAGPQHVGLRLEADGYETLVLRGLEPRAPDVLELGTWPLRRLATVDARVVDAASGLPVAGAEVSLVSSDADSDRFDELLDEPFAEVRTAALRSGGVTNNEGRVRVPAVYGRQALARVSHVDFAPAPVQAIALAPKDGSVVVFALESGAEVLVRTTDPQGRALGGVRVLQTWEGPIGSGSARPTQREEYVRSDANGEALFAHLAPGHYAYRAYAMKNGGGAGEPARISVEGAERFTVQLALPQLAPVYGFVARDGAGVPGLQIHAVPKGELASKLLHPTRPLPEVQFETRTQSAGDYRLPALEVGSYTIYVVGPGGGEALARSEIELTADGLLLDFDL